MTKVILLGSAYLQTEDKKLVDKINNELTFKRTYYSRNHGELTRSVYLLQKTPQKNVYKVPIGYKFDPSIEIEDRRAIVPADIPEPKITLYEYQQNIIDKINDNSLLIAKVGWGKTFAALHLMYKFKQRTLVIVHNIDLLAQWVYEIKNKLGIDPGVISKGKIVNYDSPIIVGNIQSVIKMINKIKKDFGLLIIDEVHKLPADSFSVSANTIQARYKIGLTGTLFRADKMHLSIPYYFSDNIVKSEDINFMAPTVFIIETSFTLSYSPVKKNWAQSVTELLNNIKYENLIRTLIYAATQKGHKVLVVADRIRLLRSLSDIEKSVCITSKVKVSDRELLKEKIHSGEANVLLGTTSIFKEGISINSLSALILTTPISPKNVEGLLEQVIGRVTRVHPGKLDPVIYDIKLSGGIGNKQGLAREDYYMNKGYKMNYVRLKNA